MNEAFSDLALSIAQRTSSTGLLPVIEKELIHYDILAALGESGWLKRLVFQGGTCLRLCYGGVRYSEDLDFNTPEELNDVDLSGFAQVLTRALARKYELPVRVKEPRKIKSFEGGGTMKRWQVVVDTAPERPDLPSQRIKIEIAAIPSHTREVRVVNVNYPEVASSFTGLVVPCQSLAEILADKLISFASSVAYPRYRDLWDIPWIVQQGPEHLELVPELVQQKHSDYGCTVPLSEMLASGRERALELAQSEAFLQQMERFIAPAAYEATLAHPGYASAAANVITDWYRRVERETVR